MFISLNEHKVGDMIYDPVDGLGYIKWINEDEGCNYPYRIFYFKNELQSLASKRTINDLKICLREILENDQTSNQ